MKSNLLSQLSRLSFNDASLISVKKDSTSDTFSAFEKSIICTNCFEMGHMSINCKKNDSSNLIETEKENNSEISRNFVETKKIKEEHEEKPNTDKCFNCGKFGHLRSQCPQLTDDSNKNDQNNKTFSRRSDFNNNNNFKSEKCYECGENGHTKKHCPTLRNNDKNGEQSLTSSPVKTNGYSGQMDNKTVKCYQCNEFGHVRSKCPQQTDEKSRDSGKTISNAKCYNCGESGHLSRACPKSNDKSEDDLGKSIESQKPKGSNFMPEELDLSVCKKHINRGINFDYYDKIEITITGDSYPEPISSFDQSGLHPKILRILNSINFKRPTPIQRGAIPLILGGRDLMAIAQTGSGKSAAFLLPILSMLLDDSKINISGVCSPIALLICPTRELANQLYEHCSIFSESLGLNIAYLYGGLSVFESRQMISKNGGNCHILISTMGRLVDFLNRNWVKVDRLKYLIIDEADRILDKQDDVESIKKILAPVKEREELQTLWFSATFCDSIFNLVDDFLKKNHLMLSVGEVNSASHDVSQEIIKVCEEKQKVLKEVLDKNMDKKVIVFCETKRMVDFLAIQLAQVYGTDRNVCTLHSDRTQAQRHLVMYDFKNMVGFGVMFATQLAGRGLDISGVDLVINYDLPKQIDEYVHRIGRTGRCGMQGSSIGFFDPKLDTPLAPMLVKKMLQANQPVPDWLGELAHGFNSSDSCYNSRQKDHKKTGKRYVFNKPEED